MQKRICSFRLTIQTGCISLLLLIVCNSQLPAQTIPTKKIPVIELAGNGYERGLQHGTQLKSEIAAVFAR